MSLDRPPERRGRPASFWIALLLGFCLLMSLAGNGLLLMVAAVAGAGMQPGLHEYEEVLVDGEASARERVVMVPIHGVIMEGEGTSPGTRRAVTEVRTILRALREDDSLKAVVLDIDSPGGGVTASDQIYHELARFKKDTGVPVVALFGDVAASGGYYVAMASDHIVAHGTTLTGSIGVISQFPVVKELMDKVGIEINTIKSLNDQGRTSYKDIGSPFRDMTVAERALFQKLITEMWTRFTDVVAEGRKGKLTPEEVRRLADGRIFSGREAMALKLVDSVGYQEEAFGKARELASAPEAKVIRLQRRTTLFDVLGGPGLRGASAADLVQALERAGQGGPRLMYLWSGH